MHLQFAYYESSLVIEYLVEKYGLDMIKQVLTDLGAGVTINEALGRHAGGIEAIDKEFTEFARKKANEMAPKADWSVPEILAAPCRKVMGQSRRRVGGNVELRRRSRFLRK